MAISQEVRGHAHIFAHSLAAIIGAKIGDAQIRSIIDQMGGRLEGISNPNSIPPDAFMDIARQVESFKLEEARLAPNAQAIRDAKATDAAQTAAGGIADRLRNGNFFDRGDGRNSGATSKDSGARFDAIIDRSSAAYWITPAGMAETRAYASQHLPWAVNDPDLLRLGPSAIKALADVHLKKENYERLTKEFHLKPTETVETAKRAKKLGVDLNQAAESSSKIRAGLPAAERPGFEDAIHDYLPKLGDADAREKFNKKMEGYKARAPKLAPQINDLQQQLRTTGQAEQQAKQKDEVAVTAKNNTLAGLNAAPAAPAAPASEKPATPAAKGGDERKVTAVSGAGAAQPKPAV